MLFSKSRLSLLLIVLSVVHASPLSRHDGKSTLRFATRINLDARDTSRTIADKDRARVQVMKLASHHNKRDGTSFDVSNIDMLYTAQVGVGDPPNYYTLAIDTGSSITWVGANQTKPYVPTNTSVNTGDPVSVFYGSGIFSGEEWLDTVTLSSDLVIKNQSIGAANSSIGFDGLDGILGVGPVGLTVGVVTNTNTCLGSSSSHPPSSRAMENSCLVAYDNHVTTSSVKYVPLTKMIPSANYWGIEQSISYGHQSIMSETAGIVDTGTTLILIATDAFEKYTNATGGIPDQVTGLLSITSTQYSKLKTLTFKIGSTSYDLTPNGQIWPRALNTFIGGSSTKVYLIVADIGSPSGSGLDFTNGYVLLERFYSVFDTTKGRVGFATTKYTYKTPN